MATLYPVDGKIVNPINPATDFGAKEPRAELIAS
jgi:hypothetical protein